MAPTASRRLAGQLGFPFLAQNMRDTEWNEAVFEPMAMIERGGVRIAVIGQAFPYTPIANPRWMMPSWSFGIREDDIRANVDKARREARRWSSCCRTTASTSIASWPRASAASTSS